MSGCPNYFRKLEAAHIIARMFSVGASGGMPPVYDLIVDMRIRRGET
jgi:hypothetical protein